MKKKYSETHDQSISVIPLFSLETELSVEVFKAYTTLLWKKTKIPPKTQIKAQAQHNVVLQGHAMNEWSDKQKTFITPGV